MNFSPAQTAGFTSSKELFVPLFERIFAFINHIICTLDEIDWLDDLITSYHP